MRSSIVTVFGEMYYKLLDKKIDELIDDRITILRVGQITNRSELETFVGSEISKTFPLNEPQWRIWVVPSYEGDIKKSIWVWKNHHSLADGISCMSMTLQLDNTYNIDKLIKFPQITWSTRMFLKLMLPISFL